MRWTRKGKDDDKSIQALADAQHNLRQTRARTPEVRKVYNDLRQLRERNHFAEQLQAIMGGQPR